MNASVVAALAVTLAVAATAQPATSAPPAAAHDRNGPFCSAFRDDVVVSVGGILADDKLFTASLQDYATLAHADTAAAPASDSAASGTPSQRLLAGVHNVAGNLTRLDKLKTELDGRVSAAGSPAEVTELGQMRDRLATIEKSQTDELTLLGGLFQRERLAQTTDDAPGAVMQAQGNSGASTPTGQVQMWNSTYGTSNPAYARIPTLSGDDNGYRETLRTSELNPNAYQKLVTSLQPARTASDAAESALAGNLGEASPSCNPPPASR